MWPTLDARRLTLDSDFINSRRIDHVLLSDIQVVGSPGYFAGRHVQFQVVQDREQRTVPRPYLLFRGYRDKGSSGQGRWGCSEQIDSTDDSAWNWSTLTVVYTV